MDFNAITQWIGSNNAVQDLEMNSTNNWQSPQRCVRVETENQRTESGLQQRDNECRDSYIYKRVCCKDQQVDPGDFDAKPIELSSPYDNKGFTSDELMVRDNCLPTGFLLNPSP